MSNDNVHLMIEKLDTIQEDMVKLQGQFRYEALTKLDLVFDAIIQLSKATVEKLERTEGKLDEVIECTRLKEQKPIVFNRVGNGGVRKRKTPKRKAKDEAKRRLKS
jgi:hypothetical protein